MQCVMNFLKIISDSMEFLCCGSFKTKLSPKKFSNLFTPHDSARFPSLFTNLCGLFGNFSTQKDPHSNMSESMEVPWLTVLFMLLRSVYEKLREKCLLIYGNLIFIYDTGYAQSMKSTEKIEICSNQIRNVNETNDSPRRMQMRSNIVDITTQVICGDEFTSSLTDVDEIRTYVRIDTSPAPIKDWYQNRNFLSLVGLVMTVYVFSALRCVIFSGDVQRDMPLSKSTTTFSLRSSPISPITADSDRMKNSAWIYTSEKFDMSTGCSIACSMCAAPSNAPTDTREMNKPDSKMLDRQLINLIVSTRATENNSYSNSPYPVPTPTPTEERFFPTATQQVESIDTSRRLSSHCEQHDQDGIFECPSGSHSIIDLTSAAVTDYGVSSSMIGQYPESVHHAAMDVDTGVVSTGIFSASSKSTGNKIVNYPTLEYHQVDIAANIADQSDIVLFNVPSIFDYDQRVEKSAFVGFGKNYRNLDYSTFTERPVRRFTVEDVENIPLLKAGPSESPIQYCIDYVAKEMIHYKSEKFGTLRDDMKNSRDQIILALKKAIQFIMSAIKFDLNELESIVESFTSIVIDGYQTVMKYLEMEFHRW